MVSRIWRWTLRLFQEKWFILNYNNVKQRVSLKGVTSIKLISPFKTKFVMIKKYKTNKNIIFRHRLHLQVSL